MKKLIWFNIIYTLVFCTLIDLQIFATKMQILIIVTEGFLYPVLNKMINHKKAKFAWGLLMTIGITALPLFAHMVWTCTIFNYDSESWAWFYVFLPFFLSLPIIAFIFGYYVSQFIRDKSS